MPPSPSLHSLAESGFELGSVGLSYMFPTNATCTPTQDPFPIWPPSPVLQLRPSLFHPPSVQPVTDPQTPGRFWERGTWHQELL